MQAMQKCLKPDFENCPYRTEKEEVKLMPGPVSAIEVPTGLVIPICQSTICQWEIEAIGWAIVQSIKDLCRCLNR
jgi:hypothetical protein